uniref:Septin-type G domain-containing protein n=1 Tax=Molossus molossus TaxID=27622 RepID=A0A7J8F8T8_MOLMO|nr:hypothetical protein HJG59_008480 [Molossus molossus]
MVVAVGGPAKEELRNLSLSGHVGFDSLRDQLVNKPTSKGFCFNTVCVGEMGIVPGPGHYENLDNKVNIIPIIAKADTIAKNKLHKFKSKIMSELVSNGVQIYQYPIEEETVAEINSTMSVHLPFAVVGSNEEVKIGNKMAKARQYRCGVVWCRLRMKTIVT